jgi:hypothetical protein
MELQIFLQNTFGIMHEQLVKSKGFDHIIKT